ncbi:MAG: hypothetical protein H6608_07040 [Flavobacteriales bacterium]|nr:hypothetical protein [Bacteroidota bacterium]MCB9240867.1 hypothetical protein [Flavobacteriales bacterium]
MNFLAHYYFDQRPGEPYHNLGLLFPDLFRNFIRGGRLKVNELTADFEEGHALINGCLQHISSDKLFHNWDGFHALMDLVTSDLRQSGHTISKDWFIAHILSELVIDEYLARTHERLATELYTDFEQLELNKLQQFFEGNELANFEQFERGLDRFMEVRYLEKYQDSASILYALGRICTKVNLPAFTEQQQVVLGHTIDRLLAEMPVKLNELKALLE